MRCNHVGSGASDVRAESYIRQLRAMALAAQQDHSTRKQPLCRLRTTVPLSTQITELVNSLPPSQRCQPWSIIDLQGRLQGRYKDRPSLGNIGIALRALGWVRVRDWTNSGAGRRLWRAQ